MGWKEGAVVVLTKVCATVRNYAAVAARANTLDESDITKATVFDMEKKLVAYSGALEGGC